MTVTHVVDDPATHFVRKAEIRKNGETVISETYTGQPTADTFTYRYPLISVPETRSLQPPNVISQDRRQPGLSCRGRQ